MTIAREVMDAEHARAAWDWAASDDAYYERCEREAERRHRYNDEGENNEDQDE